LNKGGEERDALISQNQKKEGWSARPIALGNDSEAAPWKHGKKRRKGTSAHEENWTLGKEGESRETVRLKYWGQTTG